MIRRLVVALVVIAAWTGSREAAAYPQYQLSHDQTCTSCHVSPAGGNLLNENGLAAAESMSQYGTTPEFFYGKLGTPSWLTLGGDLRGASGYVQSPAKALASFPMQTELYAHAVFNTISLHVTGGYRSPEVGNEAATHVWSREHYVMWQQEAGQTSGLYVRAGRFMPVMGLRLAEHPTYIRRFGGTPLYADTYGVAVEYVTPTYEAHATGFIRDPVIDPVEHGNGGAAYAELRLSDTLALGAEGMYTRSKDDKVGRGGITAKKFFPGAKLLLQGEVQFANQLIDKSASNPLGGAPPQLIGYALASYFATDATFIDVGLGHYDENLRIKDLDRDCLDVNVHWFTSSHLELILTNRIEMIAFGKGGPTGGYSLLQAHYRL